MPIYDITTYTNLADTVKQLALMVGFGKVNDPAGSEDTAVQQMISAVNQAGADMMNLYDWQNLCKRGEILIEADYEGQPEKSFDLPGDFWSFIDQTQWNKDTRLPALGPVSPQAWMQLEVRNPKIVLTFLWQIREGKLWIQTPPAPGNGQRFVFMYITRGWVRDADNSDLYKNMATKNGDVILFDDYLVVLLARVKWQSIKGFDATAAMADFRLNYENRKGRNKGAPVLSMVSNAGLPYLNMLSNVPDSGYGGVNA
jgi:hypothetical protein